ncbi:SDR family oxidoreductase [Candidatus Microgenomates bacterium]|nr:MAG: SDR family oxidoreductase [Candidatus Microgenomates bacterium]
MNEKRKVLITGSVSLLGKYIIHELFKKYDIYALIHKTKLPDDLENKVTQSIKIPITNRNKLMQTVKSISPEIIIHLAASSNIDFCEKHPYQVRRINVIGTKNILDAISENTYLIFLSTNAIFSGKNPPYKETDHTDPLTVYGQQKYEAEKFVLKHGNSLVLRCPTIFGWPPPQARTNDLPYYLDKLKNNKVIHAVNDRFFNPIFAQTVAEVIALSLAKKTTGILHVAGKETVSRYALIKKIINVFNVKNPAKLIAVPNDFFKDLAPRPCDATLNTDRLTKELKYKVRSLTEELHLAQREMHE